MNRAEIMKSYMPAEISNSKIIKAILETDGEELGQLRTNIDDVLKQFYVETATWGLDLWEQALNLKSYYGKPLDQRRSRIISKLRGMGTVTVSLIKNVAESYVYGEVEVTENPAEYSFSIKFVDTRGVPTNLDDLEQAIQEIKPAHLAVEYQFVYTTWGEVKYITWGEIKEGTWGELRERKVV